MLFLVEQRIGVLIASDRYLFPNNRREVDLQQASLDIKE
jgi:hypothetical protein